jgi:hypothetical protein
MHGFHRPDDCQVADVEEQLHPSLAHAASSHTQELQGGLLGAQGTGKMAAVQVP